MKTKNNQKSKKLKSIKIQIKFKIISNSTYNKQITQVDNNCCSRCCRCCYVSNMFLLFWVYVALAVCSDSLRKEARRKTGRAGRKNHWAYARAYAYV